MELLKEIKDRYLPVGEPDLKTREASRAILFDKKDMIPLLFVSKYGYHKLPGGGIEKREDRIKALVRECLEEAGSEIEVIGEVGKIVEFRYRWKLKQTSFCYYGKIISKGRPNFTRQESNQGFKVVWLSLDDAIETVENDEPTNYEGLLIQERDLAFLKKLKRLERMIGKK